jgi:hypothetical protein
MATVVAIVGRTGSTGYAAGFVTGRSTRTGLRKAGHLQARDLDGVA